MKTMITFLTLALSATIAHANVFCGVSSETVKGSHQYDKLIFSEMSVDTTKDLVVFVKPDGRIVRHTDKSVVFPVSSIAEGDLAIYVQFPTEKNIQLVTAKVKSDPVKGYDMVDMVLAISKSDRSLTLLSNGVAITCTEN